MKNISKSLLCLIAAVAVGLTPSASVAALTQNETVYAKLQFSGDVRYVSVTEHLVNDLKESQLFDESILSEIENLNGYEGFIMDGEKVTWDANGKDIYYRGRTEKTLPIKLEISYKLNGEEKSLEEILGKSGKVEIRLEYTNLSKVGNMYTPFVAAVATTFDEAKVRNVEVTNGKAVSNGRTVAVSAIAAPGLYESLGLEELKGTDEVKISFEAQEFALGDIYSIVTPKILDTVDLTTFAELDDLYAKSNQLAASSQQLVNGAAALKDGANELQVGVQKAKQTIRGASTKLDEATLTKIRTAASNTAAAQVEAQRATIEATIKAQVENNTVMMDALNLEAAKLCSAQIGGATCPTEAIAGVQAQLVAGVEANMAESSMTLAKTTAMQTAAATAENVAIQVASTIQEAMMPSVISALDMILGGVNQLAAGADKLNNGMVQFDREGIQALNNFVNGKVRVTTDKVERLVKMADAYNNYAGLASGAKGTTKFILMVEGKKQP